VVTKRQNVLEKFSSDLATVKPLYQRSRSVSVRYDVMVSFKLVRNLPHESGHLFNWKNDETKLHVAAVA